MSSSKITVGRLQEILAKAAMSEELSADSQRCEGGNVIRKGSSCLVCGSSENEFCGRPLVPITTRELIELAREVVELREARSE